MFLLRFALRLTVVVLTFRGLPLIAQGQPTTGSGSGQYVGVDVCQGCHQDSYDTFAKSVHVKTLKRKHVAEQGCEGCHGPGAAHVNSGGDPDQIERYTGAKPEVVMERCQRCHIHDIGNPHTAAQLSCLTCHSAHHPRQVALLLVKPPLQLCRGCHSQEPSAKGRR